MKFYKRVTAFILSVVTASLLVPQIPVKAEEPMQQYVVMAKNEKGCDKVDKLCGERAVEVTEESAAEMSDKHVVVAQMTETEAERLERDRNIILVEEDIILDASLAVEAVDVKSSISSSELQEEQEIIEVTDVLENVETVSGNEHPEKEFQNADMSTVQWNMDAMHIVRGSDEAPVKIALLDSGVAFDPDIELAEQITVNPENQMENPLFDDTTGHGTAMAGVIAAKDNGEGITGVNPNVQLYSVKILNCDNQTTLSQVVASIYYAMNQNCDIINMSFGTRVDSEILHQAVIDAYNQGILLIAAAGNKAGNPVEYPAAYDEVMAVGGTDAMGHKMTDTCDGEEIDILAPGSQVITTGLYGGYLVAEGTSIAAAQVSGAASLIWSKDKSKTADFVRHLLETTAQMNVGANGASEAGLVDVEEAFRQYDVFADMYTEQQKEYADLNDKEPQAYEDVELVNGSWSTSDHQKLVSGAVDSAYKVDAYYISLMQKVVYEADHTYQTTQHLHGLHNYVKGLKFLYKCSRYLKMGKDQETAIQLAKSGAGIDTSNTHDVALVKQTRNLLNTDYGYVDNTTSTAKSYKVLGFAMHLVGDTYAHRTIVPAYTVSGTNPKNRKDSGGKAGVARFGSSDFKSSSENPDAPSDDQLMKWAKEAYNNPICQHWNHFQRTVNLGVMEFRDIKYYTPARIVGAYEDNSDFCVERFRDAKLNCAMLMDSYRDNQTYDGIYILSPTENYVKLNALKKYAEATGENISAYTDAEWAKMSTPELY